MPGGMNTDIVANMANSQGLHAEGQKMLDVVVDALHTSISDTRSGPRHNDAHLKNKNHDNMFCSDGRLCS